MLRPSCVISKFYWSGNVRFKHAFNQPLQYDKINKLLYLERKPCTSAKPGFPAGPLSRSNWNLEMLVFVEGGKLENPEKNPRNKMRTNNKLNLHTMLSWVSESNLGHIGGRRVLLSPLFHPCSLIILLMASFSVLTIF